MIVRAKEIIPNAIILDVGEDGIYQSIPSIHPLPETDYPPFEIISP